MAFTKEGNHKRHTLFSKGKIMVSYYYSFSLGWVGRTPYPTPPLLRLGVTPSSCAAVGSHRIGKPWRSLKAKPFLASLQGAKATQWWPSVPEGWDEPLPIRKEKNRKPNEWGTPAVLLLDLVVSLVFISGGVPNWLNGLLREGERAP